MAPCCNCVIRFHCFPSFTLFFYFYPSAVVLLSLPFVLSVSCGWKKFIYFVFPSLIWSSHCSVCLVLSAGLFSILLLSLSIAHLVKMQFSLPSAISSIQDGNLAAFILSTAIAELRFKNSIQYSPSISVVSLPSSVSSMKELSLSWSQSVLELLTSAVS